VVPCTREATVVHAIDNLGGKLGSFDRLEKGLQDGETWSRFDRALSGSAYFGRPSPDAPDPAEPLQQPLPAASGE
jgi:3'-5' exoribonuclease